MNPQFQRLKDSLHKTWWSEDILFDVISISLTEWKEINHDSSRYLNDYIQQFPLLQGSEAIAETPIEQRIWIEITEEKAKWCLNRLIAISLPFKSEAVPQADAMQLVDDVICQFSSSALYYWPDYRLTYATFEEQLVIVDQGKLLFVMRMEED